MLQFKAYYSRQILVQLALAGGAVIVLILAARGFINDFYLQDQLTPAGVVVNVGILLLFFSGMAAIVANLWRYRREESMLMYFIHQLQRDEERPAEGVHKDSIIRRRYYSILKIGRQHAPINHGALASTLLADEGMRISFPKFVNNILILTGVFGTIVALAIALVGASDLLDSAGDLSSMNTVIHGMSTALSTTITAIICYLFFGYFYLKLTDVQTQLLSGVEQVTSFYLLPKFTHQQDGILSEVVGLVKYLNQAADKMHRAQGDYAQAGSRLRETIAGLHSVMGSTQDDIQQIKRVLQDGFRLPYD